MPVYRQSDPGYPGSEERSILGGLEMTEVMDQELLEAVIFLIKSITVLLFIVTAAAIYAWCRM